MCVGFQKIDGGNTSIKYPKLETKRFNSLGIMSRCFSRLNFYNYLSMLHSKGPNRSI